MHHKLRPKLVGLLLLFGLIWIPTRVGLQAQTNTAEVFGTVSDTTGAVLPGATVVAIHQATQAQQERVTDDQGQFLLTALPVGTYVLTAELPGFKRLVRDSLVFKVGQRLRLDLQLELGDISENVTVSLTVPLLQENTAEISDVIDHERVVELPLNGRQFIQLALLSEGVVKPPGGTRGAALQQAGALVNVGGQRAGHNIYLLDGVKVTDELFNNLVISPSVDAVQEFKIQKSMYAAEFGGKASALINVVSKSGGNELHGTLFEFHRNAALDAKNFFDAPDESIPPFVQNQFGGTLGGPLPWKQDAEASTFFFLSYEGQRIRKSITRTFSVPTAAMRSGDLSELGPIYDPLTTDPVSGQRQNFGGNRIPAERLDPVALALLDFVPLPNRPGTVQNLVATPSEETDMDQFNLKLDHLASPDDSLFTRISVYNVDTFQPFGTTTLNEALLPGFGRFLSTRARNLAFSYTRIFSPAVFNEFRFGWLRVTGGQRSENEGFDFAAISGLRGVTTNPQDMGFPQVSLGGEFSTIGDPTSFVFRTNQSFEFFDNLAIRRGNHQIKFGGYWFHLRFNPSNPEAARGSFDFTPRFTSSAPGFSDGSALADFLLGAPTTGRAGIGRGEEDGRSNWFHFYLQDDWRVTPSLTLNLGLRYEYNQQMMDVNNELSAIDPSVPGGRFVIASDEAGNISPRADSLLPLIPIPYATSAAAGWSRSLLTNSPYRLAPRLGLAWRIGGGDTVLRSGFGIFRNQWAYSVQQNLARNLPFFFLKELSTTRDTPAPPFQTVDMLAQDFQGSVGGNNMDHDFRTEYTQTWTLGIQHLLLPETLLELQYMGSRTVGADNSIVRNVPRPGEGPISARRAIPELSGFRSIRWDGWSTYNAFIARLERKLSNGLAIAANYTFSKSIDDASAPGGTSAESNLPQDGDRLDLEKALSSFHHAHLFTANFIYEIPLGRGYRYLSGGWLSNLLGGWKVMGIVTLQSGAPFTVNTTSDPANVGPGPAQRPNRVRDPNLHNDQRDPVRWFDTQAFALPAPFTFGDVSRNSVFGPPLRNVDFSLTKTIPIRDSANLQFRAEFFNLFNTPNFESPNRFAFTPNFGRIFSAGPSRQIQFGLKLTF